MAPAAPPGNALVMRGGEAYSVTKVSQGKEKGRRAGQGMGTRVVTWTLPTR